MEQSLCNIIKKGAEKSQIKQAIIGTAKNIRDTLCDVERENAPTLLDVRLNAIDGDLQSFVTVYPEEGSKVIVGIIENLRTEAVVLRCSEVEKVNLKIGDQTLKIDKDGFVFNDGTLDGMIKIRELTEKINALVDAFNSHTHTLTPGSVVVVGSAATQNNAAPITVPAITSRTQAFRQSDYENERIKQ